VTAIKQNKNKLKKHRRVQQNSINLQKLIKLTKKEHAKLKLTKEASRILTHYISLNFYFFKVPTHFNSFSLIPIMTYPQFCIIQKL